MAKRKSENDQDAAGDAAANGAAKKTTRKTRKSSSAARRGPAPHPTDDHSHDHDHDHHDHDHSHDHDHDRVGSRGYGFVGRMVYGTAYAVSYGVSFPVLLIAHVIPADNAIVHGFKDGAAAARDMVAGMTGGEPHAPALDSPTGAPAALPA